MTDHISYTPKGVCSRRIDIDIEDGIVTKISFTGGCSGNTQGVAALAVGMTADEVIEKLGGIRCGFKPSSCPDQLACALRRYREIKKNKKGRDTEYVRLQEKL